MAVDVGALHFGGEITRRLARLQRQHEPRALRQRRGDPAEFLGVQHDPGVA